MSHDESFENQNGSPTAERALLGLSSPIVHSTDFRKYQILSSGSTLAAKLSASYKLNLYSTSPAHLVS